MAKSARRLTPEERKFQRKIARSRWALYFERLWPRLWVLLGLVGLFVLISLFGVWPLLSETAHLSALGAFGVALCVAVVFALAAKWPTRDEAIHRLELRSGVPHRPASTYDDTLSSAPPDGATAEIWKAHRERLRAKLDKLHVATPVPRTDKFDHVGLRAVLMLAVVAGLGLVGDASRDRLLGAFRMASASQIVGLRLDAWVTPPPYTRRPPILVADGSSTLKLTSDAPAAPIEVPEKSAIVVRIGGKGEIDLTLEYLDRAGQTIGKPVSEEDADREATINQVKGRLELGTAGARVLANGAELARWQFKMIADQTPTIAFAKDLEKTRRGAMKLYYRIEDDYGIASAEARLERLPLDPGDPKTSWARPEELKGPRPPLERPPRITLRVPPPNAKKPETWSFHELGSHPWAGMPVRMTLVARDHAGHVGKSKPKDMVLPERLFFNPLAKAVLEQRRRLVFDPRYRNLVVRALDALTFAPDDLIKDKAVYLGLRSVRYRLRNDAGRRSISSAVEQMWHIALRIENGGGLSEAERRLREIQEKLSKAIERGASQKEIQELMRQLRQALAQFLNQLARQAERMPPQNMPNNMDPNQMMSSQDLQRMLDNLEQMMRQGSRQSAQEMLSQLRDLLDRLQSGRMVRRPGQGQQGQGRQMMQMMDRFGNLIGRQQQLMDDTFGAQRQGQQGQGQQRGQRQGQGQQQG
ncbi:MAG: TIGR02302 family protein, partial [Hyphomicrobiaceae bacterium]